MVFLLILGMPVAVFAGKEKKNEPVGKGSGSGDSIQWQTSVTGHDHITLSVLAPDGEVYTKTFGAGKGVSFSLRDLPGKAEDGPYTYELSITPKFPSGLAKQLGAARAAGDDKKAREILRANGLNTTVVQTGTFTVSNGSIVPTDDEEGTAKDAAIGFTPSTEGTAGRTAPGRSFTPAVEDQVIPDDLIVQGSGCFGFDCVNNESFGFDTIRLKENNLRIKAEDTSVGSFPTNDWQLTFNDSASGGASKFSVEDITGSKVPLTITAGAATNSIFVDSIGRVGFRTSTPVLDLHVNTNNTPSIRLEQNSSGGFTAQTWDVAGNEANFFVRDVTSGSRLPFRIRPGAPTSSVDISADGDIGINTGSPFGNAKVAIQGSVAGFFGAAHAINTNTAGSVYIALGEAASTATPAFIQRYGSTHATKANFYEIGQANPAPMTFLTNSVERMRIDSGGTVTITGNLTVTGTKAFATVDPADSKKAFHYVALEGPEAGTYFRGTAKTVNGEVVISLPGYFSRITECERMTVQLTPVASWGQIYVARKSPDEIVIRTAEGSPDLEFDYFVQGVRKGYLDFQVERENKMPY
jgi:hypothetical protein